MVFWYVIYKLRLSVFRCVASLYMTLVDTLILPAGCHVIGIINTYIYATHLVLSSYLAISFKRNFAFVNMNLIYGLIPR